MRGLLAAAALLFLLSTVVRADPPKPDQTGLAAKAQLLDPDSLKWRAIVGFPPGGEFALIGDAQAQGAESLVHFPSAYHVPPHWHTYSETLVVVKGKLWVTIEGKQVGYGQGSVLQFPPGLVHALDTGWRGVTFYVRMDKPFDLFYVNPEDKKQ